MSLIVDVDQAYLRLADAGPKVSALVREMKGQIPPPVYERLQTELLGVAAGINDLKIALGVARMTGEVEQRPPQNLDEMSALVRVPLPPTVSPFPKHAVKPPDERYRQALRAAGDDTLTAHQNVLVSDDEKEGRDDG